MFSACNGQTIDFKMRGESLHRAWEVTDGAHHLPHLHHVILGDAGHHPWHVCVPGKVGDLGGVPTVDELLIRGDRRRRSDMQVVKIYGLKLSPQTSNARVSYQELWGPVLRILGRLFSADFAASPSENKTLRAQACVCI